MDPWEAERPRSRGAEHRDTQAEEELCFSLVHCIVPGTNRAHDLFSMSGPTRVTSTRVQPGNSTTID